MRLTTAHGLLQFKDTLLRFAFQAAKALFKQRLHPLGDKVLVKKRHRVNFVGNQVRNIQHGITALGIKNTGTRDA